MKKILSIILALTMCLSLVACGGSSDSGSGKETDTSGEKTAQTETKKEEQLKEVEFETVTVLDNEYCLIEITALKVKGDEAELKVLMENKTEDKNQMISLREASINGYDCEPFFATTVAAGKKASKTIDVEVGSLAGKEIKNATDIELYFHVSDSDDFMADPYGDGRATLYPFGEEMAEKYIRADVSTDILIADTDEVKVVAVGVDSDDMFGYGLVLYLENKTDGEVMYTVDNVSVNGFMADPFWATSLSANTVCYKELTWFSTTLEDAGVETVEEIEMNFKAYDYEDWFDDKYFEEIITLNTADLIEK